MILIIIRIGIVEFVPKETDKENDYSIVDDYPNLSIYEKIQILLYEYECECIEKENIICFSPINKINNNSVTKTLPIPIPRSTKKSSYF